MIRISSPTQIRAFWIPSIFFSIDKFGNISKIRLLLVPKVRSLRVELVKNGVETKIVSHKHEKDVFPRSTISPTSRVIFDQNIYLCLKLDLLNNIYWIKHLAYISRNNTEYLFHTSSPSMSWFYFLCTSNWTNCSTTLTIVRHRDCKILVWYDI